MLRYFRPRRSLLSMSRLPLKLDAQYQRGEIENLQKVRIKKARIKPKTVLLYAVAIYFGATVYANIVLVPWFRSAAEAVKDIPEKDLKEQKPIFIAFPGTTKQLKPVPYRGSDPEWQEFVKFSKDKKMAQKVREELANFVKQIAVKHPVLSIRCGKEMKLRRYWLDVDFPQAAPPGFERKGLELGVADGVVYLEVKDRPVDSLTVFRLRQAMWPSALVQSTWSFATVLFSEETKRVAGMLGLRSGPPPPSLDQLLARHQELLKGPQVPQLSGKNGNPTQPPTIAQPSRGMPGSSTEKPALMGNGAEDAETSPTVTDLHTHLVGPLMAFKAKLAQTWKPAPNYPPKGSILVSGMVELDSPKAWLVFDVKAAYDPKTKEYDSRSMVIQLRRLQPKRQGPLP